MVTGTLYHSCSCDSGHWVLDSSQAAIWSECKVMVRASLTGCVFDECDIDLGWMSPQK